MPTQTLPAEAVAAAETSAVAIARVAPEVEGEVVAVTAVALPATEADGAPDAKGRSRASGVKIPRWTPAEDEKLKELVALHGTRAGAWGVIAGQLEGGRSATAVEQHYQILIGKRRKSAGGKADAAGANADANLPPLPGDGIPFEELDEATKALREDAILSRMASQLAARAVGAAIAAADGTASAHAKSKGGRPSSKELSAEEAAEKLRKAAEKDAEKARAKARKAEAKAAKEAADAAKAKMPKKPRSSYIFFCDEQRDKIKATNPDKSMPELARLQGELWKALSDAERQVYIDRATDDRIRYEHEMAEAGLPLVRERQPRAQKPKDRPARKRQKVVSEQEEEEEEEEEYIEWYIPEGFTVQEEAPTAEELAFDQNTSAAGDTLVGRRMLFLWEGVGWCEGVIEERNRDERFMLGDDHINFWVYYELDNNLSKHVLEVENYGFGPDAAEDSWVLLSAIEGHPAAGRTSRELTAEEIALEAADREAMAAKEAAEREAAASTKQKKGKQPAAKVANEEKEEPKEEEKQEEEKEKKADTGTSAVPKVDERYFVPASLWPDEKPGKTPHGKGWLASIMSVSSASPAGKKRKSASSKPDAEMIVRFKCDGEDESVSMDVSAFLKHCKSLGMGAQEVVAASKDQPTAKKQKKGKQPAAKVANEEKEEPKEEEKQEEEKEKKADTGTSAVPKVDERYFVPASLWPDEKPGKTPHGKGWLASIMSVSSASPAGKKRKSASSKPDAEMIVRFKCDGEDESVSMDVSAFLKHCKSLGKP